MPEDTTNTNVNTNTSDTSNTSEENKDNEPQKVYTLTEDLEEIKKCDIVREICIKLQFGKHPNKEIDALITRRFNIDIYEVRSNVLLRTFITISSIFFIGITTYGIIWFINAALSENMCLAKTLSPILGFLTLAGMAIAIFIPFPVIDENKLTAMVNKEIQNLEEQALSLVGRTIYQTLIKEYTEKQWGRDCKDLPAFIIKRLPLRFEYNNNYFNDIYQGIPKGGFSVLVENLLEGIEVRLNTEYLKDKENLDVLADKVIFTGRIDEYFGFKFGHLEWRSLRFEVEKLNIPDYQHNAVVNYTSHDVGYTRITEHKHFDSTVKNDYSTVITKEYPDSFEEGKIPYYTINDEKNNTLYSKYEEEAKKLKNVIFLGRLAKYKYFDMDDAIKEAFNLMEVIKND